MDRFEEVIKMKKMLISIGIGAIIIVAAVLLINTDTTTEEIRSEVITLEAINVPEPMAPIPDTAMGFPIPDKGYYVEELGDGLYFVTEGTYHVMFLTTGEGVIVVDAPPSMGDKVIKAIEETTDEPITHVIYSHAHADHIAGASNYPADATYIAHVETAARLAREGPFEFGMFLGASDVPSPTVTFSDTYTLTVGTQTLELAYKGPVHSAGNIFIYAPEQKVLMLIDVVFPGWTTFKALAVAENVPAFIDAHDQILEYDFDTLISGHLGRFGTREDVLVQKEYVMDMQANAATALQTVDFNAIAADVGFQNPWLLFDTYLNAVNQECTKLTEEKWASRLGGVDVFTESHCDRLVESLRID